MTMSDQRAPAREVADSGAAPIVGVRNISKTFGPIAALKNVSLEVSAGEIRGICGENGAGKSTLVKILTGVYRPDSGDVVVDGKAVSVATPRQAQEHGIAIVSQELSLCPDLSVEDNIRSVLEVTEPDRRRRDADLNALLEEFGIKRLRKTPSIALSGGERRRVEIARALASRPSYMLLDEPFAGIDPKAVVEIQKLVRHLTNRGIGVLITDHNVRETLDLTDRSYIIYSGAVLMEGGKDQIVNDPEVRRLYLGEEFRIS